LINNLINSNSSSATEIESTNQNFIKINNKILDSVEEFQKLASTEANNSYSYVSLFINNSIQNEELNNDVINLQTTKGLVNSLK
jgi:hypothetical protein